MGCRSLLVCEPFLACVKVRAMTKHALFFTCLMTVAMAALPDLREHCLWMDKADHSQDSIEHGGCLLHGDRGTYPEDVWEHVECAWQPGFEEHVSYQRLRDPCRGILCAETQVAEAHETSDGERSIEYSYHYHHCILVETLCDCVNRV
jgi:hypothetical protein